MADELAHIIAQSPEPRPRWETMAPQGGLRRADSDHASINGSGNPNPTQPNSTSSPTPPKRTVLIIVRHAERIDDHRIPGGFVTTTKQSSDASASHRSSSSTRKSSPRGAAPAYDWRLDTEAGRARPWDPPLSRGGIEQAEALGRLLPRLVEDFKLPPLGAAYASPVVRCTETALAAVGAHDAELDRMEREKTEGADEKDENGKGGKKGKLWRSPKRKPTGKDMATTLGTIHFGSASPNFGAVAPASSLAAAFGMAGGVTADSTSSNTDTGTVEGTNTATAPSSGLEKDTSVMDTPLLPPAKSAAQLRRERRKNRMKSVSDGVQLMRLKPTGSTIRTGSNSSPNPDGGGTTSRLLIRVRLEQGLVECVHKQWYDQWDRCVAPDDPTPTVSACPSGGSAHHRELDRQESNVAATAISSAVDVDPTLHPMARGPITDCFPDPARLVDMLGGVVRSYRERRSVISCPAGGAGSLPSLIPDRDADQKVTPRALLQRVDIFAERVAPGRAIDARYHSSDPPCYETGQDGLERQHASIRAIAARHAGETILCVTHFVPCAHLFGRLTGRDFAVDFGRAGYTSFSVYVHSDGREGERHFDWRPLVINDERHLEAPAPEQSSGQTKTAKKYSLRSKLYGF